MIRTTTREERIMSYTFADPAAEVLETSDDGARRVLLQQDTCAYEPENEYDAYVLDVDYWASLHHTELRGAPTGDPFAEDVRAGVQAALVRWGNDWDRIERYLRMFHDALAVDFYVRRDGGRLIGVVTSQHVKLWGCSEEYARSMDAQSIMGDWIAYVEGDVYGYVVQERARWMREDSDEVRDTWEDVESCWGFYGREYAEDSAREALAGVSS